MKRKFSILFFSILFFSTYSHAQSNDETSVRQILSNQQKSWNSSDVESFMLGYWKNDSLMFIGKSGITYGWQKTLDNYKKNYPDTATMGNLTFELLEVKPLPPRYYFVTGKWHLQRTKGNLEGYFTLLFKKINGHWFIVKDHSS